MSKLPASVLMIVIVAIGLTAVNKALAWGNVGHETVAEIAERFLKDDTKVFIQKILGPEPLVLAATFPDQVRSDKRFKGFAPYHFVEIPNGTKYQTGEKKNGHTIINKVPALLRSASLSRERKMLLLRYLIHVVGDVHQPLHVGNGYDMGGNLCNVYYQRPETYGTDKMVKDFLSLHVVWDENLIESMKEEYKRKHPSPDPDANPQKRWFGYAELTDWVLEEAIGTPNPKEKATKPGLYTREQLRAWGDTTALDWYTEARTLHSSVYPEKVYETEPAKRTYCKIKNLKTGKVENGAFNPKLPYPLLDEAYAKEKTPLVRLQLLKGGIRLARLLDRIAEGHDFKVEKDVDILESVLIENDE